jgi:predicted nucleic acid-binding protein
MSGPEPEPCFIDTNIWLYALIEDDDPGKSARAKLLIETRSAVIVSTQVINEVCVNLIKKAQLGVSPSWGRAPCLGRSYRIVG